ncbi:LysR family transcriptional regulator (plasmid) [Cupriavidus sp. KK10]|jgi:DNA-binding transcriptional LysR family regulator|uniref:LysR family transcriptional regulator n=1 Tax=Cupriavidus sp. KK10 TaxID=1478019 RepID=UPI001BAB87DB|nr:LysR family transcriptional regulator [Cupriavidus sp. KK10]QUN32138.1 LysR family transcriptional regulator [Cupriavidus sp. KK10]
MKIISLHALVLFVEHGDIISAAKAANLQPSRIRYQLRLLEDNLCAPLIKKYQGKCLPTPLGREIYGKAVRTLAMWGAILEDSRRGNSTPTGQSADLLPGEVFGDSAE